MRLRRFLTYAWAAVVLGILAVSIHDPSAISPEHVQQVLRSWGAWALPGFAFIALFRGALLIPSTPIVIAGGILFPHSALLVFALSMAGILFSASLLYRFPGFAGYDSLLAAKHPVRLAKLQVHLQKPEAIWVVAAWAFLPVVPTDLICYAAGLVRMPFRRMLLGVLIGELPLVTAYLVLGIKLAAFVPS